MRNVYDVAIVGGGASGLMCAVELTRDNSNLKVVILERNDRVGKKILATGNGQCNITNKTISENHYHGDKKFIQAFIKEYEKLNFEH